MEKKKTTAYELEVRIRLAKEKIVFYLQALVAYEKELKEEDALEFCKIFTRSDINEIVEEKNSGSICGNFCCSKSVEIPKGGPFYRVNHEENKVEKIPDQHFCCTECSKKYSEWCKYADENTQSHQLTDVKFFLDVAEKWKHKEPKLEEYIKMISNFFNEYKEIH